MKRIMLFMMIFCLISNTIGSENVLDSYPLSSPIKSIPIEKLKLYISSDFGYRKNPLGGSNSSMLRLHRGIDIVAKHHAEIQAIADGVIVEHWFPPGGKYKGHLYYGGMVVIEHEGGKYFSLYAHLSKTFVHEGGLIKKGQVIGLQGDTGRVTGEHLHFELIINYDYFLELIVTPKEKAKMEMLYIFMEGIKE